MKKQSMTIESRLKKIGQRIKTRREKLFSSFEEFSRKARLSEKYIASVENGERVPSIWALKRISNALKSSPEELFTGIKASRPPSLKLDLSPEERVELKSKLAEIVRLLKSINIKELVKAHAHAKA